MILAATKRSLGQANQYNLENFAFPVLQLLQAQGQNVHFETMVKTTNFAHGRDTHEGFMI